MSYKIQKDIEELIKWKEKEYGSFSSTSEFFHGFLESTLNSINGYKIKIPKNIFGVCMIAIKCWRSMNNPRYKKDTYDDINGYNELNRIFDMMEKNEK